MFTKRWLRAASATGIALTLVLAGTIASSADATEPAPSTPKVIARNLRNPRGIDVGLDGSVYVAESGRGGPNAVPFVERGEPTTVCLGNSGAVSRVTHDGVQRIAHFPSFAAQNDPDGPGPLPGTCQGPIGQSATGPTNVVGGIFGSALATIGLGAAASDREGVGPLFGTLQLVLPFGHSAQVADIADIENADPDGQGPDSNPYGLATTGLSALVADAGGNALLKVKPHGDPEVVKVFENLPPAPFVEPVCADQLPPGSLPPAGTPIPAQPVPTAVAVGPDGAYYVSILTGFPFTQGSSKVFRIDPKTKDTTVVAEGLSNVTGIDFGRDGSLYIASISKGYLADVEICGLPAVGQVIRVKNGTKTVVADNLPTPGDVATSWDGSVYVSVNSTDPTDGQIWKIR